VFLFLFSILAYSGSYSLIIVKRNRFLSIRDCLATWIIAYIFILSISASAIFANFASPFHFELKVSSQRRRLAEGSDKISRLLAAQRRDMIHPFRIAIHWKPPKSCYEGELDQIVRERIAKGLNLTKVVTFRTLRFYESRTSCYFRHRDSSSSYWRCKTLSWHRILNEKE